MISPLPAVPQTPPTPSWPQHETSTPEPEVGEEINYFFRSWEEDFPEELAAA